MDYRIEKKEAGSVVVKVDLFNKSITFIDNGNLSELPDYWSEYLYNEWRKKASSDSEVCGETIPVGEGILYSVYRDEKKEEEIPDGFEKRQIPAITWAVFKCVGSTPDAAREETFKRIFSEWLPQAKYEADPSCNATYRSVGNEDSPDYVAEIWFPVKER